MKVLARLALLPLVSTAAFGVSVFAQPPPPRTLLDFRGHQAAPATLHDSVLVLIDAQREYVDGRLPLAGIDAAVAEAAALLARARAAGTPVIHIVQHSAPGGALFDPSGPSAAIVAPLTPRPNELVIAKTAPNAFFATTLDERLRHLGRKNLLIAGYMTHMCVAASTHAAFDLNYSVTVVAAACATRDLPDGRGGIVPAAEVHRSHLAALADRFALVVPTQRAIAD
ncbi:MAG: cysteine hydrolase family protein [Verrucomicrobia bacterium]|nr:cysteine hydrolase family protein [Verrucomicrobiota bacterium]